MGTAAAVVQDNGVRFVNPRPRLGMVVRHPRDAFGIDLPLPVSDVLSKGREHNDHTFKEPVIVVSEGKSCHELAGVVGFYQAQSDSGEVP